MFCSSLPNDAEGIEAVLIFNMLIINERSAKEKETLIFLVFQLHSWKPNTVHINFKQLLSFLLSFL